MIEVLIWFVVRWTKGSMNSGILQSKTGGESTQLPTLELVRSWLDLDVLESLEMFKQTVRSHKLYKWL